MVTLVWLMLILGVAGLVLAVLYLMQKVPAWAPLMVLAVTMLARTCIWAHRVFSQ